MRTLAMQGPEQTAFAPVSAFPAEFRTLYDEHFDFVWRTIRRMGIHESEVEDVAQEVFLVVLRRMPEFEGRSSIRTWLHGIARNLVRNHHRKRQRTRNKHAMLELARVGEGRDTPLDRSDDRELLLSLIGELDEAKQDIYVLTQLEGLSFAEISAELGVDVNTLRTRLHAARRQLARAAQHLMHGEMSR